MATSPLNPAAKTSAAAEAIVLRFLQALEARDIDTIAALLDDDVEYTNVSMPTIRGGRRVVALFDTVMRRGATVEIHTHHIAARGDTVLTERTDIISLGPVHTRFWVCGTFRVRDGRIVLWRDHFDWWDLSRGLLRGLAGAAIPALRARTHG